MPMTGKQCRHVGRVLDSLARASQYLENHRRREIMEPKIFNLPGSPLFSHKNMHTCFFSPL